MVEVTIDAREIKELDADERGRVYLGSKYADETVQVAILGVEGEDDEEEADK